jgi:hypothetical protein
MLNLSSPSQCLCCFVLPWAEAARRGGESEVLAFFRFAFIIEWKILFSML